MSLNYNLGEIEDWKTTCTNEDGSTSALTEILIFATMAIGMNEVTESNADEFFVRLNLLEKTNGAFLVRDGKPRFVTRDEVRDHVGLHTNASRVPRGKWSKKLVDDMIDNLR